MFSEKAGLLLSLDPITELSGCQPVKKKYCLIKLTVEDVNCGVPITGTYCG